MPCEKVKGKGKARSTPYTPNQMIRMRRPLIGYGQRPSLTFSPTKLGEPSFLDSNEEDQYSMLEDSPTISEFRWNSDDPRSPLMADSLALNSPNPDDIDGIFLNFSRLLDSKNMAYEEALGNIESGLVKAEESSVIYKEIIGDVTRILGETLTCIICKNFMKSPTTLKCGHSFCRPCLQSWFKTIYDEALRASAYTMSEEEKGVLDNSLTTPGSIQAKMATFARINFIINPGYTCPSCRDEIKPRQRNSFKDFKLTECLNALVALKNADPNPLDETYTGNQGSPEEAEADFDMLEFFNTDLYYN